MSQHIRRSPYLSLVLLLAAVLVFVGVAPSLPQGTKAGLLARTPRTFVEPNLAAGFTEFYTVPAGKRFVLTDVTIANDNDGGFAAGVGISANMTSIRLPIFVCPPKDTLHVPLITGPTYEEGDVLYFMGTNVGAIGCDVYVAGYEAYAGHWD